MDKKLFTEEELQQLITLLKGHRFYLDGRAVEVKIGSIDAYNVQRVGFETERDGVEIGFPIAYGEQERKEGE